MKKYLVAFAICFTATILLSTITVTSVAAQPTHNKNSSLLNLAMQSQVICAAHWTEDVPTSGGWIFASLVRETGFTDKAWLYVSGFHPAGTPDEQNTTFSAAKRVSPNIVDQKLAVCTNMKFNVTSGDGTQTTAWHTVNVNWSLTTDDTLGVQAFGSDRNSNALLKNWLNGIWTDTDADISINIGDSRMHRDFSCSDWATIGLLSPQQALTLGHWIVNEPKAGGWVFAAAGKNTINNKAWVMVAGYHPTGALGINMPTTFQGVNSDVCMRIRPGCIKVPSACINFTVNTFVQGPVVRYETHDISLDSDVLCGRLGSDWRAADLDISINIRGDSSHSTFMCASFAMIDFDLQHRR